MQIFKQWPVYFIGRILPALIAFGGVALYTRLLDPTSFGTYALLLSTSFLFGMTGFSWLRVATIRMMATVSAEDTPDFTATIAMAFAGTSVVVAAAILVTLHVYNPSLPLPLLLLTAAAAVASNWFELNIALTQARMQLIAFGVLQGARAVIVLGSSVLLILAGLKAGALMAGFALGNCVAFGMLPGWMPGTRGKVRREILVRLFRFGWPSSATSLSYSVVTTQRYLLGIVGGSGAVGLFAVANDFATQTIGLLMGTVTIAGQPLAFRARDLGAKDQLHAQLRNNARLLFAVGFAATAGIIALAGPITHTFFGPKFRTGAEPVVIISSLAILMSSLRSSYFEQAFEIALKTRPIAILTGIRMAVTLALSFFLIPAHGAVGAAYSVLIAESAALVVSALWSRRMIRMPLPLMSFARVILATIAMVGAIQLIPHRTSFVGLAIAISVGIITYFGACGLIYFRQIREMIQIPRGVSQATVQS
jgi:O-antigen/teichoic acid export membrane protein